MVITDNNMRLRITDGEGYPYLEERFLEHLKDGNYYQAYSEYADGVDYLCAYYEEMMGSLIVLLTNLAGQALLAAYCFQAA